MGLFLRKASAKSHSSSAGLNVTLDYMAAHSFVYYILLGNVCRAAASPVDLG